MTFSIAPEIQLEDVVVEIYHASDARVELQDSELMRLFGHGVEGLSNA